ncbi:uncharacterized protein MONBRDRAFT_24380 [Monosiga brevicollis MX1]|uniref:P-type domain-containing protein n=1 Tax=Monosiga brevicollis TaxID=81824 RepID=A9UW88_MONBE|nr:uncharacterized protein MONBRDRAFT_24380 [Monosiga brevicollis MX1]EDQ90722.1 predicted protein [Monosiga brevicollis MX1]|eukprot:XP_001744773.1 hypothetical protein [Monosiga brevicollis MX1]
MDRGWCRSLRVAVGLALVLGCGSVASALSLLDDRIWGGNTHFTDEQPGELAQLAPVFKIVRTDFVWARVEHERGVYDFAAYDRLLNSTSAHDIRNYWILDYGNPLYCNGTDAPATPEAIAAFVNYSIAAMQRYATHDIIFELYNEPDLPKTSSGLTKATVLRPGHQLGAWYPVPNATAYMDLYQALVEAMQSKGLLGKVPLVAPASSQAANEFLVTCFERGMLETVDGVSVHPYRSDIPETVLNDYATLRGLIAKYTNRTVPIVSGEWGYNTCFDANGPCPCYEAHNAPHTTTQEQAQFLPRMWLLNIMAGVPISIFYEWRNGGVNGTAGEENFGVVQYEYQNASVPFEPKPAYASARTIQAQLNPATDIFSGRLTATNTTSADPDDDIFVLSFTNNSKLAMWKVDGTASCSLTPRYYQDCGYDGITEDECLQRSCCWNPTSHGIPECSIPPISNYTGPVSFTVGAAATFSRVDMNGHQLNPITSDAEGRVTAMIDNEPQYWTRN